MRGAGGPGESRPPKLKFVKKKNSDPSSELRFYEQKLYTPLRGRIPSYPLAKSPPARKWIQNYNFQGYVPS